MAIEQRQHIRYAFSKSTDARASMSLGNGCGMVEMKILNISEGGLGLAVDKDQLKKLGVEDEMQLESVKGHTILDVLGGQKIRVKWILNYEPLMNLGLGCEFVSLDKNIREHIQGFIDEENRKIE